MRPIVIDFETGAIKPRPEYPPRPVGVAIKWPGRGAKYYAWGHPTENNCTLEEGWAALNVAMVSGRPLLFHNAKFDLAVADEFMRAPMPPRELIHDTMILAFLANPYEPTFALKPLAEKHLNLPPEERDAVRDWLVDQGVCLKSSKDWGAFISLAPGNLVGRYAIGDVERTAQLFEKLYPEVIRREMEEAYNRERFLIPVLHENEKHGIRVDVERLKADIEVYHTAKAKAEDWLRRFLKAPDLHLDSNEELADALEDAGVVTSFEKTRTGKRSVAKVTLTVDKFKDRRVFLALGYRNRLQTALSTFMEPWLATALRSGGRIYTSWRQLGAVTGRFSSSPNFQNMPKSWTDKPDGYEHPTFLRAPELPLLRKYILPDEGHLLVAADYSGQEIRVAAHFEDGPLMEAFNKEPKFDLHSFTQRTIKEMFGRDYERRVCKIGLFASLYGAGGKGLGEQLGLSTEDGGALKRALFAALPGIRELDNELKNRAREGRAYRTLGGREYFAEPSKIVDGSLRSFDYKCLNYLIQGSSADMTKQAMLRYDAARKHGILLASVHDELLISVPPEKALDEARILVESMEAALEIDVPMIAEPKSGLNFAELHDGI